VRTEQPTEDVGIVSRHHEARSFSKTSSVSGATKPEEAKTSLPQLSRSECFFRNLESIHSDIMRGEIHSTDASKGTPPGAFKKYARLHLKGFTQQAQTSNSRWRAMNFLNLCCNRGPLQETQNAQDLADVNAVSLGHPQEPRTSLEEFLTASEMIDDGFSVIQADDYVEFRLKPALQSFEVKAPKLATQVKVLQVLIFSCTAVNAALALTQNTEWMPVVISFSGAVHTTMDYMMLTHRLDMINAAQESLTGLLLWWDHLTLIQKKQPNNRETLVDLTEQAVSCELGWVKAAAVKKPRNEKNDEEDQKAK
jgi:hypothetical protein